MFSFCLNLGTLVEDKMVEEMGKQIMNKLDRTAGIHVQCRCMHAKDQPMYFYNFIADMERSTTGGSHGDLSVPVAE